MKIVCIIATISMLAACEGRSKRAALQEETASSSSSSEDDGSPSLDGNPDPLGADPAGNPDDFFSDLSGPATTTDDGSESSTTPTTIEDIGTTSTIEDFGSTTSTGSVSTGSILDGLTGNSGSTTGSTGSVSTGSILDGLNGNTGSTEAGATAPGFGSLGGTESLTGLGQGALAPGQLNSTLGGLSGPGPQSESQFSTGGGGLSQILNMAPSLFE